MKLLPKKLRRKRAESGQSLTEFTIVLAMMLSIILTSLLFLAVFSNYGDRVLRLIGLEAP